MYKWKEYECLRVHMGVYGCVHISLHGIIVQVYIRFPLVLVLLVWR